MVHCARCDAVLVPDDGAPDDPVTYQFDNALWIAFWGGYGMFVDNLEARLPINTEDRWLRDETGAYIERPDPEWGVRPVEDPDWQPKYREERVLPGQPDYETVICHDCAHALCEAEPWLNKLLRPHGSHSHKTPWKDAHPDHWGWDYDKAQT